MTTVTTTVSAIHPTIARMSPRSGPLSGRAKIFGGLTIDSPHSKRSQRSGENGGSPQSQLSVHSRISFSSISPAVHAFCPKSPFDTLKTKAIGQELEYRMDFEHPERDSVSPWHDLPHQVTASTYTMVVEIPRGERAKLEVQPMEPGNPIKQDIKNGKPRFFQLGDLPFNYGMIPQTWEDPRILDKETGLGGDGDPLDVVEISGKSFIVGGTHEVKVLGALGLIDEGEMDWKLVVVDVNNPFASQLNDIADVEKLFPGKLKKILHWYRFYKVPEGKGENQFAFNGEFKDAAFATMLIDKHHQQYMGLIEEGPKDTRVWTPPGPLNALKPTKCF